MKKQKKNNERLQKKAATERLAFQVAWGWKKLNQEPSDIQSKRIEDELRQIADLELTDDVLAIQRLIEGIRNSLGVSPVEDKGDFIGCMVASSLGIARSALAESVCARNVWNELIKKKLVKVCFPADDRPKVVEWAKSNGYNTSTYLGNPIVKFSKLYIIIDRTR